MHTSFFSKHSYNLAFISRLPASSISSCGFVSTKPFTSFFTRWQGINVSAKTIPADARQANAVVNPSIVRTSSLKSARVQRYPGASLVCPERMDKNIFRVILFLPASAGTKPQRNKRLSPLAEDGRDFCAPHLFFTLGRGTFIFSLNLYQLAIAVGPGACRRAAKSRKVYPPRIIF